MIAGSGRNVGKTFLAEKFIRELSRSQNVIGLKISSHMHVLNDDVIVKAGDGVNWIIGQEQNHNSLKDSGRLLKAGVTKVIYAQIKMDKYLMEVINWLRTILLNDQIVVCESAALGQYILPGCAFFVSDANAGKQCSWDFNYTRIESKNHTLINPPLIWWSQNRLEHMMTIEEAKQIIEEVTQPMGLTVKRFDEALFHTLAEDIQSKVLMPPFNRLALSDASIRRLYKGFRIFDLINPGLRS